MTELMNQEGNPCLVSAKMMIVVDGVESFTIVSEEDEELFIILHFPVVRLVETPEVVRHLSPKQKHLLVISDQCLRSVHYREEENSGNQTVAGVVHRDGTGVFNQEGFFLGEWPC